MDAGRVAWRRPDPGLLRPVAGPIGVLAGQEHALAEQREGRAAVGPALEHFEWPQLIIIGGGISNVANELLPHIELRTPIVPAHLRNHAGIIGAALYAPQG